MSNQFLAKKLAQYYYSMSGLYCAGISCPVIVHRSVPINFYKIANMTHSLWVIDVTHIMWSWKLLSLLALRLWQYDSALRKVMTPSENKNWPSGNSISFLDLYSMGWNKWYCNKNSFLAPCSEFSSSFINCKKINCMVLVNWCYDPIINLRNRIIENYTSFQGSTHRPVLAPAGSSAWIPASFKPFGFWNFLNLIFNSLEPNPGCKIITWISYILDGQ